MAIGDSAARHGQRRRAPRRRIVVALITVIVIAVAGLVARFAWLPEYRPVLHPQERFGIDVSHHQGRIDWGDVAADGISFAYVKATEANGFVDPTFDLNWRGAVEAGIDVGAYHVYSLCNAGAAQARNFLEVLPNGLDLPPAVDLEFNETCDARPPPPTLRHEVVTFVSLVEERTGRQVVLYVSDDFEDQYAVRSWLDRPRWLLSYLRRPDDERWWIWQVGGFTHVEGIQGTVDLDVMRMS